jgi:nucleotide-binding universal stress UspA family protein
VAERVAEAASVPTLVVRDPAPLLRWARGEGRLRIFVGADFSAPSEAALRWVDWLRKLEPCEIVVACLEAAPMSDSSGAVFPSLFMDEMVLKTTHLQERIFRHHVRAVLGSSGVRARFEKGWSHSDAHLIQLAAEEHADLIVVGTHSRHGWHRLGHHSVSRGVLRYAPRNVLCVPGQAVPPRPVFPFPRPEFG